MTLLERPIYIVAKIFATIGSKVFQPHYKEEFLLIQELMLQAPNNMEVVVLTDLETYEEYAPYEIIKDFKLFKDYILKSSNSEFIACSNDN